jgi:hypothetical protein
MIVMGEGKIVTDGLTMEILEDENLLNAHGLADSVDPTTALCRGSIVIHKEK